MRDAFDGQRTTTQTSSAVQLRIINDRHLRARYHRAWVRIRSASKSCANIKLRRPRERSRARAPRRTNPSRSAPRVERAPPRSTCRGALDRFGWRSAAFTHRFARARSRGARSRGLRAPSRARRGCQQYRSRLRAPRRGRVCRGARSTRRRRVRRHYSRSPGTLRPRRGLSRAGRVPLLRRLGPRFAFPRGVVPPRGHALGGRPRVHPPAIGSWAAPPTSTRPRRGKPPSRAKYSATSTATAAATSTRDPARSPTQTSPFPSTPSPPWPTSTIGSTKPRAEAATRFDASPARSSGTTTRRRCGTRAILPVFSRLTPTPGTRRIKDARAKRRKISRLERRGRVRTMLERHHEHLRHHRGRVPVFVLMGETTRVLRSDPALRPEFLGRGAFGASRPGKTDASISARRLRDARTGGRAAGRGRAHAHAPRRVARRCVDERRRKRPTRRLVPRRSSGRRRTPRDRSVRRRTLCRMELERVQGRKRTKLSSPGRGANGTSAACFEVSPGGRLAMHCMGCEATAKPFVSAREIRFWIRSPDCERDPTDEPPVYLGVATRSVRDYETGTTPGEIACGWKTNVWTHVESTTTDSNCGRVARVPTRSFGCGGTAAASANALFFELSQSATRERELCVDDVRILS